MISDSQIRYGSRVSCHGSPWRPWRFCHAITRAAKEGDRPRGSARTEPLLRLGGGLGLRVLREQVLERAPRTRAVAEVELRGRDVEHRVGHLRAVRVRGDQL